MSTGTVASKLLLQKSCKNVTDVKQQDSLIKIKIGLELIRFHHREH
jgi:hypothetical protein